MNAPPIVAGPPPGRLHARRCVRHPGREAAARCPGCAEFFCRECVVEHGGKLLCATCLARAVAAPSRQRERFATLGRAASTVAAFVLLWLLFYWVGLALRRVPPDYHDGTVWKKLSERTGA